MIDLHCHIIPGVDDGAKTMEESIEMARIAQSEGIDTIVATPHYLQDPNHDVDKNIIIQKINELNTRLKHEGIDVKIIPGHEVYVTHETHVHLDQKSFNSINNTNYVLVEFPFQQWPIYVEDIIYEIRLRGMTPVIAHPERYLQIQNDPNKLLPLLEQGAITQMNSGSILGFFGDKTQKCVETLLKHNMIHCVGTDAHSPRKRSPRIQESYKMVQQLLGKKKADLIFKINNYNVISNQEIVLLEPVEVKKPKFILKLLMNVF